MQLHTWWLIDGHHPDLDNGFPLNIQVILGELKHIHLVWPVYSTGSHCLSQDGDHQSVFVCYNEFPCMGTHYNKQTLSFVCQERLTYTCLSVWLIRPLSCSSKFVGILNTWKLLLVVIKGIVYNYIVQGQHSQNINKIGTNNPNKQLPDSDSIIIWLTIASYIIFLQALLKLV